MHAQAASEADQLVEELFVSGLVFPQEKDELQVRTLASGTSGDGLASFEIEYGVTDRLQIELELDGPSWGVRADDRKGEIGLQQSFLGVSPWDLHAAVSVETEFSGAGTLPEQAIGLALGKDLDWLHGTHLFAGTRHTLRRWEPESAAAADLRDSEAGEARNEWFAGMVLAPSRTIRITNEWNSMQAEFAWVDAPKRLHWTPGLVWKMRGWGEAGVAVSLPLQGHSRSPWVTLSFTREFEGVLGRSAE